MRRKRLRAARRVLEPAVTPAQGHGLLTAEARQLSDLFSPFTSFFLTKAAFSALKASRDYI